MAFVPLILSYPYRIRAFSAEEVTLGVGIINICVFTGLGLALKICCLAPLTLAVGGLFLPEQKAS